jgi:hypothetical protein
LGSFDPADQHVQKFQKQNEYEEPLGIQEKEVEVLTFLVVAVRHETLVEVRLDVGT